MGYTVDNVCAIRWDMTYIKIDQFIQVVSLPNE